MSIKREFELDIILRFCDDDNEVVSDVALQMTLVNLFSFLLFRQVCRKDIILTIPAVAVGYEKYRRERAVSFECRVRSEATFE